MALAVGAQSGVFGRRLNLGGIGGRSFVAQAFLGWIFDHVFPWMRDDFEMIRAERSENDGDGEDASQWNIKLQAIRGKG